MPVQSNTRRTLTSRRHVLRGAALGGAGLAATTLLACGGGEHAAPAEVTQSVQPKRGGVFTHKMGETLDAFSSGFDPHVLNAAYTALMGLFYQNLIRYHPKTLELEPEIAQTWEQRSATEYVFRLAPGVKWHNKPPLNGRELTAQDIVYSLERARTNDPKFINRALLGSVDKLEATDKSTVRMTTKQPDVTALFGLADVSVLIVSPEIFEKGDRLTTAEQAVGTGAFILQSYQPDVGASLTRNPDYWKPGLPYLDGMKLVNIRDQQAGVAAFIAGQLDMTIVPGEEAKRFLGEMGKKYYVDWAEDLAPQKVWMNTRRRPFDDRRVVRAMRLMIDHSEAITGWAEVWYGRGTLVGTSHLPSILEAWDFSEEEYKQARTPLFLEWRQPKDEAIREALSLLSAAGITRENPLRIEHSTSNNAPGMAAAQLLQSQYQRFSQGALSSELKFMENAIHISLQSRGEFELGGPAARGGFIEPDQIFQQVYHSNGSLNFGKYSDPTADQMIEKQKTIFDGAQRKAAVKEILTHLIQNAPYTGWASNSYLNAVQPYVRNFFPEHRSRFRGSQYEQIWLDV